MKTSEDRGYHKGLWKALYGQARFDHKGNIWNRAAEKEPLYLVARKIAGDGYTGIHCGRQWADPVKGLMRRMRVGR